MQVRLPGRRTIVAHAFPSDDPDFATAVAVALDMERRLSVDVEAIRAAVVDSLRQFYPNVRLQVQEPLGQMLRSEEIWYVYRDAMVRPRSEDRDRLYRELAEARRTLDQSRSLLARSQTTASLAGYGPIRPEPWIGGDPAHDSALADASDDDPGDSADPIPGQHTPTHEPVTAGHRG
jgi:hypothetical protein